MNVIDIERTTGWEEKAMKIEKSLVGISVQIVILINEETKDTVQWIRENIREDYRMPERKGT